MKEVKSRKGDVILFIGLLGVLILIMYGALSSLEDKHGNTEESIVITADQVQSFLWILGNYSNQQSSSLDNNGTLGYNESSGIQYYSSEVNYAEIIDPTVNRTQHRLVATVSDNKFENCPPFTGSSVNLMHYLCTYPHVILFTPRNPSRVKINGQFYYSIRVLRPFKSTPSLKKALQRKVIVFVRRNQLNGDKNLSTNDAIQFQRGHIYLASVNLANNLPFITDCDLKLDWNQIPYELKSALIRFFDQPSLCMLYNYKIKTG